MATERPAENGWLPDTPVADTVLRRFLHNQAELNALVAGRSGGRSQGDHAVSLADANGFVPYYNQAVLHRPLTGDNDEVLDQTEAFFLGLGGRPGTLLSAWPTPDLTERGWQLMGHPAFVARSPGRVSFQAKPGVTVRVARTPEDLAKVEQIATEGFANLGGQPTGSMISPNLLGTSLTFRLAEVHGEAVAAAGNYVAGDVNNLCIAATLPSARRQGAWAALVWARVGDNPDLPALAYTSDDSRPGFERMGFLPVLRFTLWLRTG